MSRKAIISNRIYLEGLTNEEKDVLYNVLHYEIKHNAGTVGTQVTIVDNLTVITPNVCSIPSGRVDLIPEDFTIVDKRIDTPVNFPTASITLRPSQQEVYDNVTDSCLINAPVSWGKTFTAIAIAAKLNRKTLIVTHTTMLRDQWVDEIKRLLGITPGVVGSSAFNIEPDIVVGNIQTLTKKAELVSGVFGTVIVDECHHIPASTFRSLVDKSKARYKIGLSGTLIRKDKKHILFPDYFGHIVFKPDKENCLTPRVLIVDTPINIPASSAWATRVTDLEVYTDAYRRLVIQLAMGAAEKGHKVLVIATRVAFLKWAAEHTPNSACIVGDVKSLQDRQDILKGVSGDTNILYGTMSIFSEGISQSDLSCIILASPINNEPLLTQLIGRIIRQKDGKRQPLIIDINLKGTTGVNQAKARLSHYIRNGYDIKRLKI